MPKLNGTDLVKIDIVARAIGAAADAVAQCAREDFVQEASDRIEMAAAEGRGFGDALVFDSPLEAVYWVWWMAARELDLFVQRNLSLLRHVSVEAAGQRYIVDFVFAPSRVDTEADHFIVANFPRIAIELDGHAFHEKTLEQVTYRNERDRNLQREGWQVFHYSYSEVMDRGLAVVQEPLALAQESYWRLLRAFDVQRRGQ